ncbi:hypothetical protein EV401DRAFT_103300 [Pisolithus croceorrhizus]|nr:hypothetical protein EV401DRAFT_103300 [Pisolithus croceorrhizus]
MTMERSSTDLKSALRIRCGSALLSDGYTNEVIGAIITILMRIYPESEFGLQYYGKLLGSIMLAGTVFGMLVLGCISDCKLRMALAVFLSWVVPFLLVHGLLDGVVLLF